MFKMNTTENLTDLYGGIKSPVNFYHLRIVSAFCVLVAIISVVFNSLLLWVFCNNKKLRTPIYTFIIIITALNLFGTLSEFSFVIPSTYFCK